LIFSLIKSITVAILAQDSVAYAIVTSKFLAFVSRHFVSGFCFTSFCLWILFHVILSLVFVSRHCGSFQVCEQMSRIKKMIMCLCIVFCGILLKTSSGTLCFDDTCFILDMAQISECLALSMLCIITEYGFYTFFKVLKNTHKTDAVIKIQRAWRKNISLKKVRMSATVKIQRAWRDFSRLNNHYIALLTRKSLLKNCCDKVSTATSSGFLVRAYKKRMMAPKLKEYYDPYRFSLPSSDEEDQ